MNTPNIDIALQRCQRALLSVIRDGKNPDDGYTYVSADRMIEACREVLLSNGLVVRRRDFVVLSDGQKTESTFVVSHPESGEREVATAQFPIHYENGKEADKSVAASLTTSWGYWLRDLLALPRLDGNEMGSRVKGQGSTTSPCKTPEPVATIGGRPPERRAQGRSPVRSRPEDELYDPDNAQHREQSRLLFDAANLRSQKARQEISEQFLIGRRIGDLAGIIPGEVDRFWKKCQSATGQQRWGGGRR